MSHPLWRVINVGHNDELNVRTGPSTQFGSVGSLPPAAQGVEATGRGFLLPNGSEWIEVEANEFSAGGWVNGFYLAPMDVDTSFAALPCAIGAVQTTLNAGDIGPGTGYDTVTHIEHLFGPCERTIITLETDRFESTPSSGLSDVGIRVELPGIEGTIVAENNDGAVYVRRSLVTGEIEAEIFTESTAYGLTFLTEPARIVIDRSAASSGPEASDNQVVLRSFTGGDGNVSMPATINGLARPFEAQFSAAILDANGDKVSVDWSGGTFGPDTSTDYYAMTSDWSSAWGMFELTIDGLTPGDYTFVVGQQGADDDVISEFDFTVTP